MVDKARGALKAVRVDRPIEGNQRGRHGDCRHAFALLDQTRIIGRIESRGKIVVLELAFVWDRQELEAWLPAPAHESIHRLRRNEHDRRHLAFAHLFQRDLMRDEGLFHIETETTEDQRSRIGSGPE